MQYRDSKLQTPLAEIRLRARPRSPTSAQLPGMAVPFVIPSAAPRLGFQKLWLPAHSAALMARRSPYQPKDLRLALPLRSRAQRSLMVPQAAGSSGFGPIGSLRITTVDVAPESASPSRTSDWESDSQEVMRGSR